MHVYKWMYVCKKVRMYVCTSTLDHGSLSDVSSRWSNLENEMSLEDIGKVGKKLPVNSVVCIAVCSPRSSGKGSTL